jgi:cytoskeleton protein RodZ
MKTVGKQLQEARLAKNWTPELAARETKIKVDRLRDLETDDYSNFSSPTYARGFVRTYARALGLDEYKILRQLDNKLPDDDSANIVTDTGVAYLPETAIPARVAHRDYTGLYIVMALGAVVSLVIAFVLFEAYRVGELSRYFGSGQDNIAATTNAAPASSTADAPLRAKPIDSDTPPPIADEASITNAPATNAIADTTPTNVAPRALPVDPSMLGTASVTNAPADTNAPVSAPKALPVDPSELTNAAPSLDVSKAPRALPVDPSTLTNAMPPPATLVAVNTPPPAPPIPSASARQSNDGPVKQPAPPPVAPVALPVDQPAPTATPADTTTNSGKRLVLTASQDSFVRVTNLDAADADKPLYAAVLHSGQSVGFDGHKFSINVGIPSAVDIQLDGVNYGPHSDQDAPETFTVQSHLP